MKQMEERVKRLEHRNRILVWQRAILFVMVILLIAFVCMSNPNGWFTSVLTLLRKLFSEIGSISEVLTAFIAVLAYREAKKQIKVWREANALDTYRRYLTLAIENPRESRRDEQKEKTSVDGRKYDAFVTYVLFAAEEILNLLPDDASWRHALKLDLSHHKEFFNSSAYREDANSYTPELQELIREIRLE